MNNCFFREDDSGVLVICHNGESDQNRLRRLALEHDFNVFSVGHSLVAVQGQSVNRSGFEDLESEYVNLSGGQWLMAGGEGQARNVCASCPQREDCWRRYNGLDGTVPSVRPPNHDHRPKWQRSGGKDPRAEASEEMERAVLDGHRNACSLIRTGTATTATITAKILLDLGWRVVTSPQNLNPEVDDGDIRVVKAMIEEGVDIEDLEAVAKSKPYFAAQASGTGFPERVNAGTLDFSYETSVVHRLTARFKSRKSGATNKARRAYRASECQGCVYACKNVWSMESPCRLAPDMVPVIGGWQDREDQRAWLEAWGRWGGRKWKRDQKNFIVYGPGRKWFKGERVLSLRSLTPGYGEFDTVSEAELLAIGASPHSFSLDDVDKERLPSLFLVMRDMDRRYSFGDLRYYGDGRSKRNDVLAMEIGRHGDITIRTDTGASQHGGFGGRGSSITVGNRPRFSVYLSYPYFQTIHSQLGIRPGIRGQHVNGWEKS